MKVLTWEDIPLEILQEIRTKWSSMNGDHTPIYYWEHCSLCDFSETEMRKDGFDHADGCSYCPAVLSDWCTYGDTTKSRLFIALKNFFYHRKEEANSEILLFLSEIDRAIDAILIRENPILPLHPYHCIDCGSESISFLCPSICRHCNKNDTMVRS